MMQSVKRVFWFILATLFLIEAWLWDLIQPVIARILAVLPLARLKAGLERLVVRLPPWATALVIAAPDLVLVPVKLGALWPSAKGKVIVGMTIFVAAKMTGVVLTLFLFELCRPKLMQMAWFARLHAWFVQARAWAHAQTEPARAMLAAWKQQALGSNSVFARKVAALRRKHRRNG